MKHLIFIWLTLASVVSSAQSYEAVEDSAELAQFEEYVYGILKLKKDSIHPDTITYRYEIKYTTRCQFTETIMVGHGAVYYTSGESFRQSENKLSDSIVPVDDFWKNNDPFPYLCKEHPSKPEETHIVNVELRHIVIDESLVVSSPSWGSGYGYDNYRFLILETSGISSIGSQTSYGGTATYFLERVEE